MIKKILFIGLKYSYGEKELGESINEAAHSDVLKSLNYKVENLWIDEYTPGEELQRVILNKAKEFQPDVIFFKIFRHEIQIETLLELGKNFFIFNWFGDDQWRFGDFTSKYANYFDACITTDKFSIEKYRDIGQKNVIKSQHASFEDFTPCQNIVYKYDVSFVGGRSSFREWFVRKLKKQGIHVHCFGSGWEQGRVTYEEMREIFLTSKINLNISNSISYDLRYLMSSPKAILDVIRAMILGGKDSSQVKARIFEIPVRGGFEITEYMPSLDDYFHIGRDLVCYGSVDEAETLIRYYLKDSNKREKIKERLVERSRGEHTYKIRMLDAMQEIEIFYQDRQK